MLVPQASGYASGPGLSSFSLSQSNTSYLSVPSTSGAPLPPSTPVSAPRATYKAPAHKHAHHLHTIPPREKSTRTLIIDHMLWVHGRTRFAQARAELGMTDRTGGPSSPNYSHRRRPENYDEEADEGSEGEDVMKLKARMGDPSNPHENEEDHRMKSSQDLSLARVLRLRAEELEKVVTSILVQPPPTVHPIDDEDIWSPPNSPRVNPINQTNHHLHTLPNGVRLRLALGTIINDLFARQAPKPSYRQLQTKSSSERSSSQPPSAHSLNHLPSTLRSLHIVSATSSTYTANTPGSSFDSRPSFTHNRQLPTPNTRTRSLYSAGVDPNTANSPPSLRCPRHLYTGCIICVEAKTPAPGAQSRSNLFEDYRNGQSNVWKGMPGGLGPGGGGITGWQDGSGIGSGLLRHSMGGNCLRRKSSGVDEAVGAASGSGSGNTNLSELIPRFVKLSALVAVEMAMEAKDEQESTSGVVRDAVPDQININDQEWVQERRGGSTSLTRPVSSTIGRSIVPSQADVALRPTREWYHLLSGLLTRAALEGYLTAGWRGSQAVECLLTVGLGMAESVPPETETEEPDEFAEFEPDGLPSLREAIQILFPWSQSSSSHSKSQAEEEYGNEMRERLRQFYDIPVSTPDLSTHMEDLAWQYPAEPVERAAVRFCEAIARWRGKPELETSKKPTQTSYGNSQAISGTPSLPIASLVHSNPPTPIMAHTHTIASSRPRRPRRKPSIYVYFSQSSPSIHDTSWSPTKRRRPSDDTRPGLSKRPNRG